MIATDTPRTDEDVRLCRVTSHSFGAMVGADFARILERELTQLRARAERAEGELRQAIEERDSADSFSSRLMGNLDAIRIATEYLDDGKGPNTVTDLAIKAAQLVKQLRAENAELRAKLTA